MAPVMCSGKPVAFEGYGKGESTAFDNWHHLYYREYGNYRKITSSYALQLILALTNYPGEQKQATYKEYTVTPKTGPNVIAQLLIPGSITGDLDPSRVYHNLVSSTMRIVTPGQVHQAAPDALRFAYEGGVVVDHTSSGAMPPCIHALPWNRYCNVWFDGLGTKSAPMDPETGMQRYKIESDLQQERTYAPFRIGWASKSAIQEINRHPFRQVGDVPGSFGFSFHENATIAEGVFQPVVCANQPKPFIKQAFRPYILSYDSINHKTYLSAPCVRLDTQKEIAEWFMSIPLPSRLLPDPATELFPMLSFGCPTSFMITPFP